MTKKGEMMRRYIDWEKKTHFVFPIDGDVLNEYDGEIRDGKLYVEAKVDSDTPVKINGVEAVKKNGFIYVSFKYGEYEGYRNGRYFTDLKEDRFHELLEQAGGLEIVEEWISSDARPGRDDEKWLNAILRKN
jgi:flavodoxin